MTSPAAVLGINSAHEIDDIGRLAGSVSADAVSMSAGLQTRGFVAFRFDGGRTGGGRSWRWPGPGRAGGP